jgi:hypothetical protein
MPYAGFEPSVSATKLSGPTPQTARSLRPAYYNRSLCNAVNEFGSICFMCVCWLVGWSVGWYHLLLRDFAPYDIIFMTRCYSSC